MTLEQNRWKGRIKSVGVPSYKIYVFRVPYTIKKESEVNLET